MCLRGKRWREAQVHRQDENKWTASWWEQQRQRRWNWLNQSFILFPPICCVVIGVRVTGRMTSSSPICLNTYTCPHTHLHCQTRLCILCSGSWGKRLWLGITKKKNTSPHLQTGTQSLQEQWEVTKVILQLQRSPDGLCGIVICRQKPACVALDSGCYPECKSKWSAWLCEMVAAFSEPPT